MAITKSAYMLIGRQPRINKVSPAQSRLLGGFSPAQDLVREFRKGAPKSALSPSRNVFKPFR